LILGMRCGERVGGGVPTTLRVIAYEQCTAGICDP